MHSCQDSHLFQLVLCPKIVNAGRGSTDRVWIQSNLLELSLTSEENDGTTVFLRGFNHDPIFLD